MVTSVPFRKSVSTLLAVGQRFQADDLFSSGGSSDVVVHRLLRDKLGLLHVVLRDEDGREISAYVEQIELAIELGNLRPLAGNGAYLAS